MTLETIRTKIDKDFELTKEELFELLNAIGLKSDENNNTENFEEIKKNYKAI